MRKLPYILLVLLLVACGEENELPSIVGLDGLSEEDRRHVEESIEVINQLSIESTGSAMVQIGGDGYPVQIELVDPPEQASRLGFAKVRLAQCTVEVSPITINSARSGGSADKNLLSAVLLHEFGHCLGRPHNNADKNSIMFPITRPLSFYSSLAFENFFGILGASVKHSGK